MPHRITFVAGMAVGYVLGARAGRERYEEMKKTVREFSQNPAVRNAAEAAALSGRQAAAKAFGEVSSRLPEQVTARFRGRRGGDEPYSDDWGTSNT
ncbi:YtxH domain-containing protein [Streptomyces sp. NPDC051940]|uniref:YtxH domain-containing protein n=1 Tax=Streptomyces sp. NPDC051940 TaxID=3155675 RepID=UPI003445C1F6